MPREFINADMLAAGVSVLQQSLNTSNLRDIAAEVFHAMSEARDAGRKQKVHDDLDPSRLAAF